MGTTTKFQGVIALSRPLALPEAKTILELNEMDREEVAKMTGTDAHFQWVPTETLDGIVWDGNEKFYEYEAAMTWLCDWLKEREIAANGTLHYVVEGYGDHGRLIVTDNVVSIEEGAGKSVATGKPLTLAGLGRIALDRAAG